MIITLALLALLAAQAQERTGGPDIPPVELLDLEVNVHVARPRNLHDPRAPARPPGPIASRDDIPGNAGSSRSDKASIASRSAELSKAAGRGPGHPSASGSSPAQRYEYRLRVRNRGSKKVKSVLWEYQVVEAPEALPQARRLFLCAAGLKPGADRGLSVWTPLAPYNVVSAADSGAPPRVRAVVNRVEYADGSAWQRGGWEQPESERGGVGDAGRRLRGGECVVW